MDDAGDTSLHARRSRALAGLFAIWLATGVSITGHAATEVTGFGSNPGQLRMWKHVPANLSTSPPLVVALHGCTQRADEYGEQSGWRELADRVGFALLLPEQRAENNARLCFNWFNGWALSDFWFWTEWGSDQSRDDGEALSIKQMIDRMSTDHRIDPRRVFVTGLSGGGAMTTVMLAAYPELFAGGAILAGVPYKCANSGSEALSQCGIDLEHAGRGRITDLSPSSWSRRVRDETNHRGPWPRVSVWHGQDDKTVTPDNARELLDQWTAIHELDQAQPSEDLIKGMPHRAYRNAAGVVMVESYSILRMAHGVPIEPGNSADRCGQPGPHAFVVGICASHYIAKFWGLVN